ncbi:AlbA family DNA-binding domain-containing protein [Pseudomonas umsongensis]|uniref:AlbA family DNA-binding domain-containing protein n=1 Tax=Pseudomonas umsongensis TaxID=198618 RepID=UPI00200B7796|nr:ATP-binding protein [Pseudomonas umsongensis]MCK8655459.1 ATP-binding protein [Pseudomonas umsongensis]
MQQFSPFKKTFTELTTKDLATLRSVTEGWHIEYKREISKPDAIAKSIAALANTYGGWIFYGVTEESKENSVAGDFPGTELASADADLQKIRQAVSAHLNPACHFDIKLLPGPCEEIGLLEGRCIICVTVPQSIEAPHVHKRGVIYRRVGDSSEPKEENDQYLIEKMFQRSNTKLKEFEAWISKDLELSEEERDVPYLRLLISPNLWGPPGAYSSPSVATVKTILNSRGERLSYMPFDSIYTSAQTIIARQCVGQDPRKLTLTWKIQSDLSGEVIIPLRSFIGDAEDVAHYFRNHQHISQFTAELQKYTSKEWRIVDLSMVYSILGGIISAQRELQSGAGLTMDFYIKAKAINSWRATPFLDIQLYMEQIERNSVPVNLTAECVSPPGTHPSTFWHIPDENPELSNTLAAAFQTGWAFMPIAGAFGISIPDIFDHTKDEDQNIFGQLQEAGIRASNNQAIYK